MPCTDSTRALSVGGRLLPKTRDRGAEQREDQHPQQHRAFVIAPDARHFVDQRLRRMRIRGNVGDGKVRRHVGVHQREKGDGDQEELRHRRGLCDAHHAFVSERCAEGRHDYLHRRDEQREDQSEMSEFDDHGSLPPLRCLGLQCTRMGTVAKLDALCF